jgi:hypothetical protein
MEGDFFLGTSLATTLTKLAIRYAAFDGIEGKKVNRFCAEAMLVMASVLRLGKSGESIRMQHFSEIVLYFLDPSTQCIS